MALPQKGGIIINGMAYTRQFRHNYCQCTWMVFEGGSIRN